MSFFRDQLIKQGILSAIETIQIPAGKIVSSAGAVIIRQRPMTAKNVVFITLEDETGHSNFVVMPDIFERFRAVINQNDFLVIKGRAEESGVIKAFDFWPLTSLKTEVRSHNFH